MDILQHLSKSLELESKPNHIPLSLLVNIIGPFAWKEEWMCQSTMIDGAGGYEEHSERNPNRHGKIWYFAPTLSKISLSLPTRVGWSLTPHRTLTPAGISILQAIRFLMTTGRSFSLVASHTILILSFLIPQLFSAALNYLRGTYSASPTHA